MSPQPEARSITAMPLTEAAFAPFGTVVDTAAVAPRPMNGGMARRFHDLAAIDVVGEGARAVIGLVEAEPYPLPLRLSLVERHPLGAQAFVPLSPAPFLIVVCRTRRAGPALRRPSSHAAVPGDLLRARHVARRADAVRGASGFRGDRPRRTGRGCAGANLEEHTFVQPWTVHLPGTA